MDEDSCLMTLINRYTPNNKNLLKAGFWVEEYQCDLISLGRLQYRDIIAMHMKDISPYCFSSILYGAILEINENPTHKQVVLLNYLSRMLKSSNTNELSARKKKVTIHMKKDKRYFFWYSDRNGMHPSSWMMIGDHSEPAIMDISNHMYNAYKAP